jgi:hypothetical protein
MLKIYLATASDLGNLCSWNSKKERQRAFFWREIHGMMMSSQSSREESVRVGPTAEGRRIN